MPKKDYEEIKKAKTKKELADLLIKKRYVKKSDIWDYDDEDEMYVSVRHIPKQVIAEFGKYADFDEYWDPQPFFDSEEMNNRYSGDYELYIVSKEILRGVIKEYTEQVKTMFWEKLWNVLDSEGRFMEPNWADETYQSHVAEIMSSYKEMACEWGIWFWTVLSKRFTDRVPFNLQEEWEEQQDNICNSWWYMYSVFELVRLYKTFDDKKNVLVYYGS